MTTSADGLTPTLTGSAPTPSIDAGLAKTLHLQEVDVRRQQLETQLRLAPTELASLQRKIDGEKAAYEVRHRAYQDLEVQRKDVDNRLKSAEATVLKYKTQQAEIRKNDEYQALGHQIETAEGEVNSLETLEIEQMLKIDEAKKALQTAEAELKQRLTNLDGEIALVRRRETQTRTELDTLGNAVETAAAAVPPLWMRHYENAKTRVKRAPYLAAMDGHNCGGCHLRVSNEIAEAARHGGKPVHCDNCGRIVYVP